jgi:hypothetical protein
MLGSKPAHQISNKAYHQRITKEGQTCKQKQQMLVQCCFCEEEANPSSKNQQEFTYCLPTTPTLLEDSNTIILHMNTNNVQCPHFHNCPYITIKQDRMQRHFQSQHPNNIIIIAKEGLLPQWQNCGIYQHNSNTTQHTDSAKCKQYTKIKRKQRQELKQNAATHVRLYIDNQPVKKVSKFQVFRTDNHQQWQRLTSSQKTGPQSTSNLGKDWKSCPQEDQCQPKSNGNLLQGHHPKHFIIWSRELDNK